MDNLLEQFENIDINNNFSKLSYEITKKLDKKEKKEFGIYFTPPDTINKNLNYLEPFIQDNIINVLEPSCGSCEYVLEINKRYPNIKITAIEYNNSVYNSIKYLSNNKINIINENFINYKSNIKYDLIIGNPPYFVMKKKDVLLKYYKYFDGRPNIFILFIIKSLELLNNNGIISFILPKSFLNCLYYNKTRDYINKNYKILNIIECNDNYIDTKQETIIFIIQNNKQDIDNNEEYIININDNTIFGSLENIKSLKELNKNTKTLFDLNFKVNVGKVVWNQCKDILTDDNTKTRLIYSSDIINNKLNIKKYNDKNKKNFINKKGNNDLILVLNRGYGTGNYKFNYCLIDIEKDYLIENHLICISYKNNNIERNDLLEKYKIIINSFENTKTIDFIKIYFGNSAINTNELMYILPIYEEATDI